MFSEHTEIMPNWAAVEQEELVEQIEKELMIISPEEYLPKYVSSLQDIYDYRSYLKQLPYNDFVVNYLVDFVLEGIQQNKRFRKLDCLKVIRKIIRYQNEPKLKSQTVSKLFKIFKHYIYHKNEEVQNCVNSLLIDRKLLDSELHWIIENYTKSEHFLNRLLRYPNHHNLLEKWANTMYLSEKLTERKAEIIALLIQDKIPEIVQKEHIDTLIWSVYYAKVPLKIKATLLEELFLQEELNCYTLNSLIDICKRLNLELVLKNVRNKLHIESSSQTQLQ